MVVAAGVIAAEAAAGVVAAVAGAAAVAGVDADDQPNEQSNDST